MLTDRDLCVLERLARYTVLSRRQITTLCYPNDDAGRVSRRRLAAMCREGFVRKQPSQAVAPDQSWSTPVYLLNDKGRIKLAEERGDDAYLLKPTTLTYPQHLWHYLAVADIAICLDTAIARQDRVQLVRWIGEEEIVNTEEPDPKKHFKLMTQLSPPPNRIRCYPDAAFLLQVGDHRGVFYLEHDRGSSQSGTAPRQILSRKLPGYVELKKQSVHRTKHFPTATSDRFTVISISPTLKRRDAIRRVFRSKQPAENWRFATVTDITPDTVLHGDILYKADSDEPGPLVKG